jgi:hypothetical protein
MSASRSATPSGMSCDGSSLPTSILYIAVSVAFLSSPCLASSVVSISGSLMLSILLPTSSTLLSTDERSMFCIASCITWLSVSNVDCFASAEKSMFATAFLTSAIEFSRSVKSIFSTALIISPTPWMSVASLAVMFSTFYIACSIAVKSIVLSAFLSSATFARSVASLDVFYI